MRRYFIFLPAQDGETKTLSEHKLVGLTQCGLSLSGPPCSGPYADQLACSGVRDRATLFSMPKADWD